MISASTPTRRRRSLWFYLLAGIAAILLVLIGGFVIWGSTPLGPAPEAMAALVSDDMVTVDEGNWLVFTPTGIDPATGFILYPGGRVDFRSYAPLARDIAAAGYLVVIPSMPLSLAVLSPGVAAEVIDAFPEIERWGIGGHSLGGAMAANFTRGNPESVEGLALWAAYPAAGDSLADRTLPVTSIYGTNDGVATTVLDSAPLLPPTTTWVAIEGGNHAQFGAYGPQPGDGVATIPAEEQWRQTVAATTAMLAELGDDQ